MKFLFFVHSSSLMKASFSTRSAIYKKSRDVTSLLIFAFTRFPELSACGERGIRTPGTSQFNGFQDRRNRPLCHLSSKSGAKVLLFFELCKFLIKNLAYMHFL